MNRAKARGKAPEALGPRDVAAGAKPHRLAWRQSVQVHVLPLLSRPGWPAPLCVGLCLRAAWRSRRSRPAPLGMGYPGSRGLSWLRRPARAGCVVVSDTARFSREVAGSSSSSPPDRSLFVQGGRPDAERKTWAGGAGRRNRSTAAVRVVARHASGPGVWPWICLNVGPRPVSAGPAEAPRRSRCSLGPARPPPTGRSRAGMRNPAGSKSLTRLGLATELRSACRRTSKQGSLGRATNAAGQGTDARHVMAGPCPRA